MTDNQLVFGSMLREWRKERDLTQPALADLVGCSPSLVRMIELGKRRTSRQLAELLANTLRIPEPERAEFIVVARQSLPSGKGTVASTSPGAEGQGRPIKGNLPTQLNAFIGRDIDIASLEKLLLRKDVRLVTLTGPPGVGKTRLAVEAAGRLQESGQAQFSDGVYWVPLAAVKDPEEVSVSIARVLNVQDTGSEPLPDILKRHLNQSYTLLLLDNFEQVLKAAGPVRSLLEACSNLKALVTSREALMMYGEREFSVHTLPLPDISAEGGATAQALASNAAIALFVERAQAVDRNFTLTDKNAAQLAAICARLDGLPLAIELVAAHTRVLPLAKLLESLQGAGGRSLLNLQAGGGHSASDRYRTLRDAIGWSYDLLTSAEQSLFNRLAAFTGGFTLPAVEVVCNSGSEVRSDIVERLSELVNKNLIRRELQVANGPQNGTEQRFSMAEMIREYAIERLEESGVADEVRLAHAEYFTALASSFDPVMVGENERALGVRLDQDYDNVRAALDWTIGNMPIAMSMSFGLSLCRYWELRGQYREGSEWLQKILYRHSVTGELDIDARTKRARLLLYAGRLNLYMSNYPAARAVLEEGLALAEAVGLEGIATSIRGNLALALWLQGDYAAAVPLYEMHMSANETLGNKVAIANSYWGLGTILGEMGDFERAEKLLGRSLALARELDDTWVMFGSLRDMGTTLCYAGYYSRALPFIEESIRVFEEAHIHTGLSWALSSLAFARLGLGQEASAGDLFRESLKAAKTGDKYRIADSLEGLAALEVAQYLPANDKYYSQVQSQESLMRAATLLGAAAAVRRIIRAKIIPVRAHVREQLVSNTRARLSAGVYEQCYRVGEAMSPEEAIAYGQVRAG